MSNDIEIPVIGRFLIYLTLLLVVLGLIILSSAGVVEGQRSFDSAYFFLTHQLLYGVLPGLLAFFILSRIDYDLWRRFALPVLFFAIILMIMVFVPNFGQVINGARRWLNIGIISFQPAEFLKLSLVIYLSAWFTSQQKKNKGNLAYALVPFLIVLIFIALLLVLQPDFGTLGLLILIALALYFFSGAPLKHLVILLIIFGIALGSLSIVSPYRFNRLKTFLDPTQDTLGSAYHINQALIAIGSGGIFGVGFGQSQQKHNFLPEVVGDSIFAVVVEELGLVGGVFVITLFLVLFFTLIRIAHRSNDEFARLFVLGVVVWIVGQAFINICAISGVIPLTGLPLPFISFGSSSLVSVLMGLGIVVSVSKHS